MKLEVDDPTKIGKKKLSRREFSIGGMTLGFATVALMRDARAKMALHAAGSGTVPVVPPSGSERLWRSAQGVSPVPNDLSFMWINMLAGFGGVPGGYPNQTDANGWLNSGISPPPVFDSGVSQLYMIPAASQYSGPDTTQQYIVCGQGDGDINLQAYGGGWLMTLDAGASYGIVAQTGALSFRVQETAPYIGNSARSANPPWKIVFRRTDQYDRPYAFYGSGTKIDNSNFNNNGRYIRNVAFMRSIDHADWVAGRYYRTAFLDMIIAMNPSYIRFQAWNGVLSWMADYRFRGRHLPDSASGVWGMNVNGLLNYTASGTLTVTPADVCKYNMTGIAGTPANMLHGEAVQFLCETDWSLSSGTVPADGSGKQVYSIANGATTNITTNGVHGFHVGDKLQFVGNYFSYRDMNMRILTVLSVPDSQHVVVDFNTTGFPTWGSGPDTGGLCPMVYLRVGSGGDRSGSTGYGYPVMQLNGVTPITFMPTAQYPSTGAMGGPGHDNCFYFDKNVIGSVDPDGTLRWGAWLCTSTPGTPTSRGGTVPVEMQSTIINELENRIIATGQSATKGPICPWICLPVCGMTSVDPDYDAADNYGVGMVDIMLNGAGSFPGIPSRCILFVEYANECFNTGNGTPYAVPAASYNTYVGCHRWTNWTPGSSVTFVPGDLAGWVNNAMMRWYANVFDIKAAFPAESTSKKIRFAIALWPFGLRGPAGSPGYPTYAGGDFCLFANTTINKYFDNGSGNIPPGAPSTFYKFSTAQYPIVHNDYVSPGTYVINDFFYEAWFADVANWDNVLTSWLSNSNKKALSSFTPNATTYQTDCATIGAHNFDVGDIAMVVNLVQTGGDSTRFGMYPFEITAANKAAGTFTAGIQTGYGAGTLVSGDIITLKKGAQDTDLSRFMEWMIQPSPFAANQIPYSIQFCIECMQQMAGVAQTYHPAVKINSYEGYIQMILSRYKWFGTVYSIDFLAGSSGHTPGTYTNVNIFTTWAGKYVYGTLGDAGFNGATYAKCTVVVNGAGTVSSVTLTSGGRGYIPSDPGPPAVPSYYYLEAPFGDTLVKMTDGNAGVHVPGVTLDEMLAFLTSCFFCTGLATYVDDFFGATLVDSRLEGIANLTLLIPYGAQWGLRFNDPWAFGPWRGADWSTPTPTMQAISVLNATP